MAAVVPVCTLLLLPACDEDDVVVDEDDDGACVAVNMVMGMVAGATLFLILATSLLRSSSGSLMRALIKWWACRVASADPLREQQRKGMLELIKGNAKFWEI